MTRCKRFPIKGASFGIFPSFLKAVEATNMQNIKNMSKHAKINTHCDSHANCAVQETVQHRSRSARDKPKMFKLKV
jgi:hypothetical protein